MIILETRILASVHRAGNVPLYIEYKKGVVVLLNENVEHSANGIEPPLTPQKKLQKRDRHLIEWVSSVPRAKTWYDKIAKRAKNTAEVYASYLYSYWTECLSKRLPSVDTWVEEVKTQHKSDELEIRRSWASELEGWYLTRKLKRGSRLVLIAAIRSFFYDRVELSKYNFTLSSNYEAMEEVEQREELTPLDKQEVKTIIDRCSPLYKAIFLTQLQGGIGVSELIYFSKHGYKYVEAIKSRKIPLKISLIRSKTINNGGQPYWTLVWDDAIDALANYLKERETDFGLITKEKPWFFLNRYGKPITTADIQLEMKRLREWTGLEKNVTGKRTYRFRPHELRDTFKTWTANKHVRDIVSEFMMGHEVDSNQYNKFAKTTDGEKGIIEEMENVRPELNVLTNRGQKAELITAQKAELDQIKKVLKVLLKDRQKDRVKTISGEVEIEEDLPPEVEDFILGDTKELEDKSTGSED